MKVLFPTHDYPVVLVDPVAWDDMFYITDKVATEVGWRGTVEQLSAHRFLVTEIFLPEQEVNAATTEIQGNHDEDFILKVLDERGPEVLAKMNAWMHSHADMGLTATGQDDKMLAWFAARSEAPFVAIRTNKRGEATADIAYPGGITIEGVSVEKNVPKPDLSTKWDAAIKKMVKPLASKYALPKGKGQKGGYDWASWRSSQPPAPKKEPLQTAQDEDQEWFAEQDRIAREHGLITFSRCTPEQAVHWQKLTDSLLDLEYERDSVATDMHYGDFPSLNDPDPDEEYQEAALALLMLHQDLWDYGLAVELNEEEVVK